MHPFENLPPTAFWRTGVADLAMDEIGSLWSPRWPIDKGTRIATFGSCFAQQFGAALRARGFSWLNGEPAPAPLSAEARKHCSYDIFSVRTGNIYTARQLLQWLCWATGQWGIPDAVWHKDGRYYDPFRPTIELGGFASVDELVSSRRTTVECLLKTLKQTDMVVFTMGLTECWRSREGHEYQSAPGVFTDDFDPDSDYFHNQSFSEIHHDMTGVLAILRDIKPDIRILLTVSPVPITATASSQHVLVANAQTKSTLRAVAGELHRTEAMCDYFPGYEIVSGAPARGMFYKANMRNVTALGVNFVMGRFLAETSSGGLAAPHAGERDMPADIADPLCDEAALDAFAKP